jgi:hypothetical protein
MKRIRSLLVALIATGALTAALFAPTASADYGQGAVYQVEISANQLPGPSFWFWAELDPGNVGGDYQMTDCIHVGRGGPNAAAHASGEVESWSTDGSYLTMTGISIVGGANTATIKVALPSSGAMYGHSNYAEVTVTAVNSLHAPFPVGAHFVFSGSRTQVQLAP